MKFFNADEIDMFAEQFAGHPVLGRATRFLQRFRDQVDSISDGWCYWPLPARAARNLMELIENARPHHGIHVIQPTEADFKRALTPIKSFCTRHASNGMVMPSIE